jgi:hypothetical protein
VTAKEDGHDVECVHECVILLEELECVVGIKPEHAKYGRVLEVE